MSDQERQEAARGLVTRRDRTLVMGVVNVTPDSFSDGGAWFEADAAITHGLEAVRQGADIVDVGGESTRPGAMRPSVDEELRRVIPVVRALAAQGAVVSIDTMRAEVADQALAAGAALVNDVSGGLADEAMVPLVVDAGVPYIAMHWRGHSSDMQSRAVYDDVVEDVCRELASRRDALLGAGLSPDLVVLDPGLGFAKAAEHNWALMAGLPLLHDLGQPILLGASRKAFLGRLGRGPDDAPRPAADRDLETTATSVMAAMAGLWCVRVHDVASTVRALSVVAAAHPQPPIESRLPHPQPPIESRLPHPQPPIESRLPHPQGRTDHVEAAGQ